MGRMITWAAPVAALLALGHAVPVAAKSPAEPDGKPARQCFWTNSVNSFAAADDRVVNVRVGVRDVYQLEMLGRCPDVDWNQEIALVSRGSSSICTGLDAEIVAKTAIGPRRCAVRTVRKLTPEQVAALPPRAKP